MNNLYCVTKDLVRDGPSSTIMGKSAVELEICREKDAVVDNNKHVETKATGGSGICDAQRRDRMGAAVNGGASAPDLPEYMVVGR